MRSFFVVILVVACGKVFTDCNTLMKLLNQCTPEPVSSAQDDFLARCNIDLNRELRIKLDSASDVPVSAMDIAMNVYTIRQMAQGIDDSLTGSAEITDLYRAFNESVEEDKDLLESKSTLMEGFQAMDVIMSRARLCGAAQFIPTAVQRTLSGWQGIKCSFTMDLLDDMVVKHYGHTQSLNEEDFTRLMSTLGRQLEWDTICAFDHVHNFIRFTKTSNGQSHDRSVERALDHVDELMDHVGNIHRSMVNLLVSLWNVVNLKDNMEIGSDENKTPLRRGLDNLLRKANSAKKDRVSKREGMALPIIYSIQDEVQDACGFDLLEALNDITGAPIDTPVTREEFWMAIDKVYDKSTSVRDVLVKEKLLESQAYENNPDPKPENFAKKNYDYLYKAIVTILKSTTSFRCAAAHFIPMMARARINGLGIRQEECNSCGPILSEMEADQNGRIGDLQTALTNDLQCFFGSTPFFMDYWKMYLMDPHMITTVSGDLQWFYNWNLVSFQLHLASLKEISSNLFMCLKRFDEVTSTPEHGKAPNGATDTDENGKILKEIMDILEKKPTW